MMRTDDPFQKEDAEKKTERKTGAEGEMHLRHKALIEVISRAREATETSEPQA